MGFSIIKQKLLHLSCEDVELLMKERLPPSYMTKNEFGRKSFVAMQGSEKLVEYLGEAQVYIWHLYKIGGDREVR